MTAADPFACGRYRIVYPATALAEQGYDVAPFTGENADIVVLQRPMHRNQLDQIRRLQSEGVYVVVELDDRFDCLTNANLGKARVDPRNNPDQNHEWLARAITQADHLTCTTTGIGEAYKPGGYTVIPNFIPEHFSEINPEKIPGSVMYAGSLAWHRADAGIIGPGLSKALLETGSTFVGFGDRGLPAAFGIRSGVRATVIDGVPIDQYPHIVARAEIGIAPVRMSPFGQAKSCLKMMEYAALGVYPIGSPIPDNVRLHEEYGIGTLCKTRGDWYRAIKYWASHPDERAAACAQHRETVYSRLTYGGNASLWANTYRALRSA